MSKDRFTTTSNRRQRTTGYLEGQQPAKLDDMSAREKFDRIHWHNMDSDGELR